MQTAEGAENLQANRRGRGGRRELQANRTYKALLVKWA